MARPKQLYRRSLLLLLIITLGACAAIGAHELNQRFGEPRSVARSVAYQQPEAELYRDHIQPLLNQRCVHCHACYDAPCQLKLSSAEGLQRGLSKKPVYSGTRLLADKPTRLFVDHQSTEEWRENGFHPALNERAQTPDAMFQGSLLYRVLDLKRHRPFPSDGRLPEEDFDFSLHRENQCPKIEEFDNYANNNPQAGMPYGFPALSQNEMELITQWVEYGALLPKPKPLSKDEQQQLSVWEQFLNQGNNRSQLVSRYLYEHLFLANLYFSVLEEPVSDRRYYKIVRSTTPPGEPIDLIATRRPVDNPNTDRVYYRLQPQTSSLVAKTHLPYELSPKRMNWFDELFFKPRYEVKNLPGYEAEKFNPFRIFKSIPAKSRYRFLLEESHYFIAGFIKGPVCRGQVAVDVINDQFWVFFVKPESNAIPMLDGFLEQQADNLRLPGSDGSNAGILSYWTTYSDLHRKYLASKSTALQKVFKQHPLDLDLIWDGDGDNTNAALTVFRNFDDAAVVKGLMGNAPKTAWVIDYPLLERIHYLLTADFDVFGNVGHQLNTRLYMDFLRIEGEYNFLTFLPPDVRVSERDYWYREAEDRLNKQLQSYRIESLATPSIDYQTPTPKLELYEKLRQHIGSAVNQHYQLTSAPINSHTREHVLQLQQVKGKAASLLSETTLLMVEDNKGNANLFTVLANRAHLNITSLFREQRNRLPNEDSITVAWGVIGDYPNTFLSVTESDLPKLVEAIHTLQSEQDYQQLLDRYGVRRTHPEFWAFSDRLHQLQASQQPERAGILDYNRFENR